MDQTPEQYKEMYSNLSTELLIQEDERMHERAVDLLTRCHVVGQILQERHINDTPVD